MRDPILDFLELMGEVFVDCVAMRLPHPRLHGLPMGSLVVEDRELLPGQDPLSARALGSVLVTKIYRSIS